MIVARSLTLSHKHLFSVRQGVFNEHTAAENTASFSPGRNKDLVTTNDRSKSIAKKFSPSHVTFIMYNKNSETITTYKLGFCDELELFRCTEPRRKINIQVSFIIKNQYLIKQ